MASKWRCVYVCVRICVYVCVCAHVCVCACMYEDRCTACVQGTSRYAILEVAESKNMPVMSVIKNCGRKKGKNVLQQRPLSLKRVCFAYHSAASRQLHRKFETCQIKTCRHHTLESPDVSQFDCLISVAQFCLWILWFWSCATPIVVYPVDVTIPIPSFLVVSCRLWKAWSLTYFFSGASREHKAGTKVNNTSYLNISDIIWQALGPKTSFQDCLFRTKRKLHMGYQCKCTHYHSLPGSARPMPGGNFEKMKPAIRN